MQSIIEAFVNQVASGKSVPAVKQASVFPMLDSVEYNQLKSNMRKRQLIEVPIYINEQGHIVDGRNRVRALQELKLSPDPKNIVVVPDHKITEMVIALNIRRRHLSPGTTC
jgi:ParB-like chromosome segregation protein Spo0J